MKKIVFAIIIAIVSIGFGACKDEIDFSYHTISPLYSVEGTIDGSGAQVYLSQTLDMDSEESFASVAGAKVTICDDEGRCEELSYMADGYYRSGAEYAGVVGRTYTLSVEVENEVFESTSRMSAAVEPDSVFFYWVEVLDNRYLVMRIYYQDIADEENHYYFRISRNGELYKWGLDRDQGNDGKQLKKGFYMMNEETAKDDKEEDQDKIVHDGDIISIELRTIDLQAYDYLYSLDNSSSSGTNPVGNFTGGEVLGYFSAFSRTTATVVYKEAEVLDGWFY